MNATSSLQSLRGAEFITTIIEYRQVGKNCLQFETTGHIKAQ